MVSSLQQRLSPEEQLLFCCMKSQLNGANMTEIMAICTGNAIDWPLVLEVARSQGVGPLMYANLKQCLAAGLTLRPQTLATFKECMFESVADKERKSRDLLRALLFFNDKRMDVMLLKGAALNLTVYKHPWHVTALDIDILIRQREDDVLPEVRDQVWAINNSGPFECNFRDHHDLSLSNIIPINYDRIWDDARQIDYQGCRVHVMSAEDMLIAQCLNGCRKRYFFLKDFYALNEIITHCSDLCWDRFAAKALEYKCNAIVYTALLAARTAVDSNVPQGILDKLNVGLPKRALLKYLIERMSYSPLASRCGLLQTAISKNVRRKSKWNWSVILSYASYRPGQIVMRLTRILSGATRKRKKADRTD
jgi:hypothetical protein